MLESGGADDEHKSTQLCEEPEKNICEVSYANHKVSDIQLRATIEGVLFSCPHHSQHVHMIVRNALSSIKGKGDKEMWF